jgi:hypothetical protein
MKLTVPEVLKTILVDDWEAVTKNNQVRRPELLWLYIVADLKHIYSLSHFHANQLLSRFSKILRNI